MAAIAEAVQNTYPEIVRYIVDNAPTLQDAVNQIEERAKRDPGLKAYLTDPWLRRACEDAAGKMQRHNRDAAWTAPNYDPGGNGSRVLTHARTLLDFPLPNGVKLRDAKKGDLEEAARFYREQAEDMAAKAQWLDAIAAKVGRKKVASVFDADALQRLRE